jgi:hypothetical protein
VIPIRTAIRVSPAAWFAIPIAIFAVWYVTLLHVPAGYGVAASGAASGTLPFIGAFVGGSAAWEGSRLRCGGIWGGAWPRSGIRIGVGALAAPVVAGWLAFGVAVAMALIETGSFPPDPLIVAVGGLDIVAYAAVGLAIGVRAPTAMAVPVATILPLLWLAFVPAMQPVWMRHLTGMFRDCCGLAEAFAPRAALASILVNVGLIGAAAVASDLAVPPGRRAFGVLGILVGLGVVSGALVDDMSYAPVMARDPSALRCTNASGTQVCLWPEDSSVAPQIDALVGEVSAAWRTLGVRTPATFTEALGEREPDAATFRVPAPLTRDRAILSFATAITPPTIECPVISAEGLAGYYLRGWYAAAGGLSEASIAELDLPADGTNKSLVDTIRDLRAANPSERARWIASATQATQVCSDDPPDLRVRP